VPSGFTREERVNGSSQGNGTALTVDSRFRGNDE